MTLTIKIALDNAAFDDETGYIDEVERLLDDIVSRLPVPKRDTRGQLSLHDHNGNWVGYATITKTRMRT